MTKLSLDIFYAKFKEIELEPPNLFIIPKFCNCCTKFKKDLVMFKKKQWCLKCFFKLKKEEGIVFISTPLSENNEKNIKAFYFKNGLSTTFCERCCAYSSTIHYCEICTYSLCSNCYDLFFVLRTKKRCTHRPSQYMKIKN